MAPTAPKRSQEFISKSDDEDNFQATDEEDIKPKSLKKKVVVQAKKSPAKKPAAKKSKRSKSSDGEEEDDEEEEEEEGGMSKNKDGDSYLLLATAKRVTVRKYKGSVLIDIRETYEKDGETLPGKKGISLTIEQFNKMKSNMTLISKAIEKLE